MIESDFPYIEYRLLNNRQTKVYLTPRPDSFEKQKVSNFFFTKNPSVRFVFTDDRCPHWADDYAPFHWYPWRSSRTLPIELVYPAISLLREMVEKHNSIWLHCDSSSMRAPTFFGLFLKTMYSSNEIKDICANTKWTDDRRVSCPIEYSDVSLRLDGTELPKLIQVWKDEGATAAHSYFDRYLYPDEMKDSPFWSSPPGHTIKDFLEASVISKKRLTEGLCLDESHVDRLLNGVLPIDITLAERLNRILGVSVNFWLTREANYRNYLRGEKI